MRFVKGHGLGNDFVLLDRRAGPDTLPTPAEAISICDRHRGVGADGVLTLLKSAAADARLVIQNSDGSRPEMCGNGARVAALWLAGQRGAAPGATIELETDAGPRPCRVWASSPSAGEVEVGMGPAKLEPSKPLDVGGRRSAAWPVSMGNPHRVLFLDVSLAELQRLAKSEGPALSKAEDANIELVSRIGAQRYACVVYERGAGLTQACGTGACAVAAAAIARGEASAADPVTIELPGGPLTISVAADFSAVQMRGPAELVFEGAIPRSL